MVMESNGATVPVGWFSVVVQYKAGKCSPEKNPRNPSVWKVYFVQARADEK